ncbi:MAG: VOC family protein [Bacteroidetes bacterium]|nr:VOC family protein [Bacteroidota bacterium]
MKIGHLEIFVKDPIASKDFYEKILGFTVTEIQHDKFVWMNLDDTQILLRPGKNDLRTDEYNNSNIGIVLYTDDVDRKKSELENRGLVFSGFDGSESCLTFKDPDGNWFQLVDPDHT